MKKARTAHEKGLVPRPFCPVDFGRWLQGAGEATLQEMLERPDVFEIFIVRPPVSGGDVVGCWTAAVGVMSPRVTDQA